MQSELPERPTRQGPLQPLRDFLDGVRRAAGLTDTDAAAEFEADRNALFDDAAEAPLVLVVGATGRTGRIVVRKLLLRGYRVRVLVRNLYSSTLDLLGTGVEFVKGDLSDYDSLFEATADVDKVVFAAGIENDGPAEMHGICSLIRALQDARVADFGAAEATKRSLFHFNNPKDLGRWAAMPPTENEIGERAPRVQFSKTASGRIAFMGQVYAKYVGFTEVRCAPVNIDLTNFSGLILRCVGDGNTYTAVLRTASAARAGYEYYCSFDTQKNRWSSVRLPLSSFRPRPITSRAGTPPSESEREATPPPTLNRGEVRQVALQFAKPSEMPEKHDGRFYLGVEHLKAYRTQDEPDFVLVSCASVSGRDWAELDEHGLKVIAAEDVTAWKYVAENRLRSSGLTYTIVRPGVFTDAPGGNKAFTLDQGGDISGAISRADVAEICVRALLDPRACNVTFDAFESMYAPTATTPSQDVSSMLSRLQPNT